MNGNYEYHKMMVGWCWVMSYIQVRTIWMPSTVLDITSTVVYFSSMLYLSGWFFLYVCVTRKITFHRMHRVMVMVTKEIWLELGFWWLSLDAVADRCSFLAVGDVLWARLTKRGSVTDFQT